MNRQTIDCNRGHRYYVRVRVLDGVEQVEPTVAGTVTGLEYRFSDEKPRLSADGLTMEGGVAIHADLDALVLVEDADDPALFTVDVSQALHQLHLRPLGRGTEFYGIPSKDGVANYGFDTFVVAISTNV